MSTTERGLIAKKAVKPFTQFADRDPSSVKVIDKSCGDRPVEQPVVRNLEMYACRRVNSPQPTRAFESLMR